MSKNQFVAVVGFSRSGTSLISRILAEVLGIDFGEAIEHIPKNAENPDGFFENQRIMDFNESVLSGNNASVIDLPPVDFLQQLPLGELDALAAKAKNLLSISANSRPSFGFKDPRLCLTLPIWRLAAPNLKTVIIVRSPWGALQSFSAQMHRPLSELEPLWFEYQHRILLNTAGADRFMLSFERLLSHPLETVTALAKYLELSPNLAQWEKQLAAIVKPGRVANLKPAEPFEFSPHFQPKTKLAYLSLNTFLATGAQPDFQSVGALFQGIRGYEAAYLQPLNQKIIKLDRELREQIGHVIARDISLAEHIEMVQVRDARIVTLGAQLETQIGRTQEQIHQVIARDLSLAEHIKMVQERDATLAKTEKLNQAHQQLLLEAASKTALFESRAAESAAKCGNLITQLAQSRGHAEIAQQNEASAVASSVQFKNKLATLETERTIQNEGKQHLEREIIALATTVDELKAESREYWRQKNELLADHQVALQEANEHFQNIAVQAASAHSARTEALESQLRAAETAQQTSQIELISRTQLQSAIVFVARKKDSLLTTQTTSATHRLKQLIFPSKDLWNLVSPIYSTFKTETQTSLARQRGLGLYVASPILAEDATIYELTPEIRTISKIQFILDDDLRVTGELHFELLSPKHVVLARCKIALVSVGADGIAHFQFPTVSLEGSAAERLTIRLFTKDAADPVRLYEMQRRSRFSGNITTRAAFIIAT